MLDDDSNEYDEESDDDDDDNVDNDDCTQFPRMVAHLPEIFRVTLQETTYLFI